MLSVVATYALDTVGDSDHEEPLEYDVPGVLWTAPEKSGVGWGG